MTNFRNVSWFRFIVIVVLSICTSLSLFFSDEALTKGEIFVTLMQAVIAGFSYLQCPESVVKKVRRNNVGQQNSKL